MSTELDDSVSQTLVDIECGYLNFEDGLFKYTAH